MNPEQPFAVKRLTEALAEARAADDAPLVAFIEPQLKKALALAAARDQAAPAHAALAVEVAATKAELDAAETLRNLSGTPDRAVALQRRDDVDALRARLVWEQNEYRDALARRDTPATALQRMGVDQDAREAFRITDSLLTLLIRDGHSSELANLVQKQGDDVTIEQLVWLNAAERRTRAAFAERKAAAKRGTFVFQLRAEDLEEVFAARRRAIETRRRRLANAAQNAATEAQRIAERMA